MEAEAYEELQRLETDHWWYRGMRAIVNRILMRIYDSPVPLKILDAGCGTGGNLTALARYGTPTGIDYSRLALSYAAQYHRARIGRASVVALPFAHSTFDLVTSFDVIYAREVPDDTTAIAEFARVTRPGGRVLIRVPALPALRGPHDDFVHGIRRYTTGEMRSKLLECGLAIERITYANSVLLPLVFVSRQIEARQAQLGATGASDVGKTSGLLDRLLEAILVLESWWIGMGGSFPAGVSLIAVARKPDQG